MRNLSYIIIIGCFTKVKLLIIQPKQLTKIIFKIKMQKKIENFNMIFQPLYVSTETVQESIVKIIQLGITFWVQCNYCIIIINGITS